MNPLQPSLIEIDQTKINRIEEAKQAIFRQVTFCRNTSSKALLNNFLNSTNSLTELLSIKNAQMEAQNEEEAKQYLHDLDKAILFVINEIKNGVGFESQVQLFQLLRKISPETHDRHPNKFRSSLVQVGSYLSPEPNRIPSLVEHAFEFLQEIKNPIIKGIYLHHELVRIHPFTDANGRISRIAKNWVLMYHLYPPIFIRDEVEKQEYIRSLSVSFSKIEEDHSKWHEATRRFFELELGRILDNTLFILRQLNQAEA